METQLATALERQKWINSYFKEYVRASKFMPYMGLKGDTSRSAQNILVQFSDDDYQTFTAGRNVDMTSKEKMLARCGSYRGSRIVRLSHTGNTEVRLSQFLARIE